MLRKVISSCPCSLPTPSSPRPECSTSAQQVEPQASVLIVVVYFQSQPLLHCVDQCTKWSETGLLRSRRLKDQIAVLRRIQVNCHGSLLTIRADQDFNKKEIITFCEGIGATLIFAAANHHEANAVVERAKRTICSYFDRISRVERNSFLVDAVSSATFYKNICRRHEASSSF